MIAACWTENSLFSGDLAVPSAWPAGNVFSTSWPNLIFINYNDDSGGDYHLSAGSHYAKRLTALISAWISTRRSGTANRDSSLGNAVMVSPLRQPVEIAVSAVLTVRSARGYRSPNLGLDFSASSGPAKICPTFFEICQKEAIGIETA
jgi:hypothetical protein